ncbi:MAG: guanylate kinase [Burkholderiales bacterium]|nr:guanylate kinase [Burkholderiales bacterium]
MSGNLYIVSAPSGAGKTSLVAALLEADNQIRLSVSYTTRQPRPGEIDGRHYQFVTTEKFEQMAQAGDFLESALVHGNRYGTSHKWVEQQLAADTDIVLEIDWQGAAQVRRVMSAAISIFILPPSFEALLQRLNSRAQDPPDVIARRLANARDEIAHVTDFDYVIINSEFRVAAAELQDIIRAERLRTSRQLNRNTELFKKLRQE